MAIGITELVKAYCYLALNLNDLFNKEYWGVFIQNCSSAIRVAALGTAFEDKNKEKIIGLNDPFRLNDPFGLNNAFRLNDVFDQNETFGAN